MSSCHFFYLGWFRYRVYLEYSIYPNPFGIHSYTQRIHIRIYLNVSMFVFVMREGLRLQASVMLVGMGSASLYRIALLIWRCWW